MYGGNPDYYKAVHANYRRLAGQVGLPVGEITTIAHTMLPLMVGEVAREQGCHEAYHRATFHAYWADGLNIGEWKVLEPLALGAGLRINIDDLQSREQELRRLVDEGYKEGRRLGVSGIPTFFIGGEQVVGAQPYEAIKEVVERHLNGSADGTSNDQAPDPT